MRSLICCALAALTFISTVHAAHEDHDTATITLTTTTIHLGTSTTTISPTSATNSQKESRRPITSSTGTTITTTKLSSTTSMPVGSSLSGPAFRSSVLNSTNYFRTEYQAQNVTWNATLADYALRHAENCVFEHSGGPYGENLALNYHTVTRSIDAWAAEEKDYNWGNPGFSESTGHWSQLVWKNTTQVGCGAVNCNNQASNGAHGMYLVCEYYPPGNVVGEFKTAVSKPGEKNGKLGVGAASRTSGSWVLLVALVAVSSMSLMWS